MKRLLAAGSGPIFQICKAFREDEQGAFHNPEFTMLEWYRPGFDHHALMDEVEELLRLVLDCGTAERWSYQEIFLKLLALDPLTASDVALKERADAYGLAQVVGDVQPDRDLYLQWLMSEAIEPHIGQSVPCFVYDFPASQAALARLNSQDSRVGERFEVYFKGLELANGFHELADSEEQRRRFEMDLVKRQRLGYPAVPVDEFLLAALRGDFPDSAGVALGLDRLMMLALHGERLADVMAFVISNS
jgi:lysyl-tRNA synthetase class 2